LWRAGSVRGSGCPRGPTLRVGQQVNTPRRRSSSASRSWRPAPDSESQATPIAPCTQSVGRFWRVGSVRARLAVLVARLSESGSRRTLLDVVRAPRLEAGALHLTRRVRLRQNETSSHAPRSPDKPSGSQLLTSAETQVFSACSHRMAQFVQNVTQAEQQDETSPRNRGRFPHTDQPARPKSLLLN
jgi:hypothetical protein